MSNKTTLLASAVIAGLFSGIALAEEATTAAPAETTKMEKKNECKGHGKDKCKGMKKDHKKKGDKNACSGPNGCHGNEKAPEVKKEEAHK